MSASIEAVREALTGRVLVLTGSGISAESGIPTFRGEGGYWRTYKAEELATQQAFDRDPATVWRWYGERRELIEQSKPNAAHIALVRAAQRCRDFLLVTQNVDDLHERATGDSAQRLAPEQLVHIHGEIFVTRCTRCDFRTSDRKHTHTGVPLCPKCRAPLRPAVVWFDEELPAEEVNHVEAFLSRGECNLVLVIGTTATFDYIRDWAMRGRGRGGLLVEINPNETELSQGADLRMPEPASEALGKLIGKTSDGRVTFG